MLESNFQNLPGIFRNQEMKVVKRHYRTVYSAHRQQLSRQQSHDEANQFDWFAALNDVSLNS